MKIIEILKSYSDIHVIDKNISIDEFMGIDLSENNFEIDLDLVSDAAAFDRYINTFLKNNNAKAAYGGYLERRQLYKRSRLFSNSETGERNIHIGVDIWAPAETLVLAALDGEVHSFNDNEGNGNYGPTIILHHKINNHEFYTLYGHLSKGSLEGIFAGRVFKKGEQLGKLGNATVNGGYPPHLHFQIIKEIGNHNGDYPGVCSEERLNYFKENCPDPNFLLKLNTVTK